MAAVALSALFEHLHRGTLLTFVLSGGCNLNCNFCFIEKRGERLKETVLYPRQYQGFVEGVARYYPLGGVAVVGDEPLMEAAWPSTRAILASAQAQQLPSAIITNGTLLRDRIPELAQLGLQALLISLDAVGGAHDQLRRSHGAYEAILDGVTLLARYPSLLKNTAVASIAFPGKIDLLKDFPEFLDKNEIRRWLVSPFLIFPQGEAARIHPNLHGQLKELLPALYAKTQSINIRLLVDDVMGKLPDDIFIGPVANTRLVRGLKQTLGLLRMAPDGRMANLDNVLNLLDAQLPQWDGVELPHHFLERTGLAPMDHRAHAA